MFYRHTRRSKQLAAQAAELTMAVPQVMAHRLTRMALAGNTLSERDRAEFDLMSSEKSAAFLESWQAMTVQSMRANQALSMSFFRAFWSPTIAGKLSMGSMSAQVQNAAIGVLGKGMAPVHRRAVANAKRLSHTKLRG
jgi:hypothetical protein